MNRQPFLHTYLIVFGISFVLWTMWNWFFAGDVTLIEMALLALPVTLFFRGFTSRGGRTSKATIFLRACLIVFIVFMVLASLWNAAVGHQVWSPMMMAIAAVLSVAFYGGIAYLITHGGMAALFGNDPEYRAMRESGYDPYFDSLPQMFNPDSDVTRATGLQEPEYASFVPPRHWKFQCPRCGARVEHRIDVCWRCGYGHDGRSDDYFARWGDERPSDITPDEWTRLTGKRHDAS